MGDLPTPVKTTGIRYNKSYAGFSVGAERIYAAGEGTGTGTGTII